MGLKVKIRPKKYKKARYATGNVSKKDLSKITREFGKLTYESYERKRPNYEPTNSYFYLARQLTKCMMRAYALNLHVYLVRTKINDTQHITTSHVYYKDKSELKEFLVDGTLSQICSTDEYE